MIIRSSKGIPTHFIFTQGELQELTPILSSLLEKLELYQNNGNTKLYVLKGFGSKKLYPKDTQLDGGFFTLPDTFYGDTFDLCKTYNLYHTFSGFSKDIVKTGRSFLGTAQFFPEPIFIGDQYNNQIINQIDYQFNNLDSIGGGYVLFQS